MTKSGSVTKKVTKHHRGLSHITRLTVPAHLWWSYSEMWQTGLRHWTNYWSMTNNIRSIMTALRHRSPHCTFSIRRVPMGPTVTHLWCLQFIIKFSARSFLHAMCTCGTLLHPTCGTQWHTCPTCGTRRFTCLTCGTWRHLSPSPSDLWDPTAWVSHVPIGPFSIFIRHVGPDGLRVTCIPFLHPTCGTW
jgi:hypothetical protein